MIPAEHLRIECFPERPRGGQHVGTGPFGIKVTHLPSGLVAISTDLRSPHLNKELALSMIEAGLTHPRSPRKWLE